MGVMSAPVDGSAPWDWWIARVAKSKLFSELLMVMVFLLKKTPPLVREGEFCTIFVTALAAMWVHELGLPGREVTHVHAHHGAVVHGFNYDDPGDNVNESWFFVTQLIYRWASVSCPGSPTAVGKLNLRRR